MTCNTVTNAVRNAVTHAVTNGVRTRVQNQIQNQNQMFFLLAVVGCVAETKSNLTVTYARGFGLGFGATR